MFYRNANYGRELIFREVYDTFRVDYGSHPSPVAP